jgi:hypothetical protein
MFLCHYIKLKPPLKYIKETKAPFTLRSIFGTVPLFGSWTTGTGTNFIRAVPKIERSVNGALVSYTS